MIAGSSESPLVQDPSLVKDQVINDASAASMVTPLDRFAEILPAQSLKADDDSAPQGKQPLHGNSGISATPSSQKYASMDDHLRETLTNNDFSPFKSGDHMNAFECEQYPSLAEAVEEEAMQASTQEDKTVKRLNFSPMREEEISSFYISPVTLTNDNSIRELSNLSLPPAMSISNNPFSSTPLLSYAGASQKPAVESVANDTAMVIDAPEVEAKAEEKAEEKAEDDKVKCGRKRKPTDFFDVTAPDPNKKPRAPRKPRAAGTTAAAAKAATSNPNKLSVEEEMALALAEDDEERALLESPEVEYDPKDEKKTKKKAAASTGPKKPRAKKATTTAAAPAVGVEAAAPKPKVKTLASAFAKVAAVAATSAATTSEVVDLVVPSATAMEVDDATSEVQTDAQQADTPQPVELSSETLAKVNKYSERASSLALELSSLEHNETLLDLKQLIPDELDRFLSKPVGIEFLVAEIIDPVTHAMNKAKTAALLAAREAKEKEDAKEKGESKEGDEALPSSTAAETPSAESETVSAPHAADVSGVVSEGPALITACAGYIRSIMSRVIQGQTGSLAEVTEVVIGHLSQVVAYLQTVSTTDEENVKGNVAKVLLEELQSLGDHTILQTEIKLLAERVVYTSTFATSNSVFPTAMMQGEKATFGRWEVTVLTSTFSENSIKLIKESRLVYNRYCKVIKSIEAILSLLRGTTKKVNNVEEKLIAAEEKFVKSFAEVEKMKEKKRELDLKKQQEMLEKLKKEELKEAKKREKSTADQAKAAEKAEKERKKNEEESKKAEEQRLKQAKLQKQQSFFKAFLGKPVAAPDASGTVIVSASASSPAAKVAGLAAESTQGSIAAASPAAPATVAVPAAATAVSGKTKKELLREEQARQLQIVQDQRYEAFNHALSQHLSIHDIMALQRVRYAENKFKKQKSLVGKAARRPRHISVAVTVASSPPSTQNYPNNLGAGYALFAEDHMAAMGGANANSGGNYEEVLEFRTFRNKLCVFSFQEDHRPAYVGTMSKRSTVINGRRPLKMDPHVLRYDYDSEEEWEEEDEEGEDIAMSIGGSCDSEDRLLAKDAKDELQYDDFFRRDNDFGSDVDSDIDANDLLYNTSKVQREEVYGPRCVFSVCWQGLVSSSTSLAASTTTGNSGGQVLYALEKGKPSAVYTWSNPSDDMEEEKESDGMFVKGRTDDPEAIKLMSYAATLFCPPSALRLLHCSSSSSGPASAGTAAVTAGASAKKKGRPNAKAAAAAVATPGEATVVTGAEEVPATATTGPAMIKGFDESKLPALITLLHGSKEGIDKLVLTFTSTHAPHVTKAAVKRRILEIAEKKRHTDGHGSLRWVVKPDVIQGLDGVEIAAVPFTPAKPIKAKSTKAAKAPKAAAVATADDDGNGGEAAIMKGFVNAAATSSKVVDLVDDDGTSNVGDTPRGEADKEQAGPAAEEMEVDDGRQVQEEEEPEQMNE